MKRMKIFLLFMLSLFVVTDMQLISQTATILRIDSKNYPDITADFSLKDASTPPKEVRLFNQAAPDIVITENGIQRQLKEIFCADPGDKSFSAIMVMDLSGSMIEKLGSSSLRKIDVIVKVVNDWIDKFDPTKSEMALLGFAYDSYLIKNFTTDKDSLKKALKDYPYVNNPAAGTNYNAAFLCDRYYDSTRSALDIAKYARYKPVIIFMTDGNHRWDKPPWDVFDVSGAVQLARLRNVYVFVVHISNEADPVQKLTTVNESYLRTLAGTEVPAGYSIDDNLKLYINSPEQLETTYNEIYNRTATVGAPPPCYVTWTTVCDGGGNVNMTFPNHFGGISAPSMTYSISESLKPYLDISPKQVDNFNVPPATPKNTIVKITPKNNYVIINAPGYRSSDPRFTVTSWGGKTFPFRLNKDESLDITVTYTPTDSSYSQAKIDIIGTACRDTTITNTGEIDLYANNINMGTAGVDKEVTKLVTYIICNRSGETITVQNIKITGTNGTEFSYDNSYKKTLAPGECLEVTFKFTPKDNGYREGDLEFVVQSAKRGTRSYKSKIFGNGSGDPEISSVNPFVFEKQDCKSMPRDTFILINNTGSRDLIIDSCVLDNKIDFTLIDYPKPTDIIPEGSQDTIKVRFNPSASETKTGIITVFSNAKINPTYNINLRGTKDSVNFIPTATVDFGLICMGDTSHKSISIRNTSSGDIVVIGDDSAPQVYLPVNTINIAKDATENVNIDYIGITEGNFDETIEFRDSYCGFIKTVRLTGEVANPRIQPNLKVDLTSNVLVAKDTVIRIYNNSQTDMTIIDCVPQDPQFKAVILSAQKTIKPGEYIEVRVTYTPDKEQVANTTLLVTATPCNYSINVPMVGNPSLATIDIEIDRDYTGFVGEDIQIKIHLRNANKFAESNTQFVKTKVSFDETLLEQQTATYPEVVNAGIRTITLDNLQVTNTNTDQVLATLSLRVIQTGTTTSTELVISDTYTESDKKNVKFNIKDGLFTLNPATALLEMSKTLQAMPGEKVQVPIYIRNATNITNFNEGITAELRFSSLILEPVDKDLRTNGSVVNDEWVIPIELPVQPAKISGQDSILRTLNLRAMLGYVRETDITLDNAAVKVGQVKFNIEPGKFKLLGICEEGDLPRLFDHNDGQAIAINLQPNPATGITDVSFEAIETGHTKLWVSDILGNCVLELYNGVLKSGEYTEQFDASKLPTGFYIVILQTPTQSTVRRMYIVR